jgi:hypothetical protein
MSKKEARRFLPPTEAAAPSHKQGCNGFIFYQLFIYCFPSCVCVCDFLTLFFNSFFYTSVQYILNSITMACCGNDTGPRGKSADLINTNADRHLPYKVF